MKKLLIFILLLISVIGYAQNNPTYDNVYIKNKLDVGTINAIGDIYYKGALIATSSITGKIAAADSSITGAGNYVTKKYLTDRAYLTSSNITGKLNTADSIGTASGNYITRKTLVDYGEYLQPDSILLSQSATYTSVTSIKYPTLAAEVPSDGADWSDSSNVYSSNNVYASTYSSNDCSDYLKINDFGFTIPSDAIITGITVDMECKSDSNNFYLDKIYVLKNDIAVTGVWVYSAGWILPTTDTVLSIDSSNSIVLNSMWGTTWTPAQINDSLFGINIRFCNDSIESDTLRLDYVKITISYNNPVLLSSSTKITPYGITVGTDPYVLESEVWNTIDSAKGNLDMRTYGISGASFISSNYIESRGTFYWNQEEHRVGVINEVDTIDWSLKNVQELILDDTCEITFLTPTYPCHLQLKIVHDASATSFPVTFSNGVLFKGGTNYVSTAAANAVDILDIYFDDTYYYINPLNDFKP
jgi:hypothetical protein